MSGIAADSLDRAMADVKAFLDNLEKLARLLLVVLHDAQETPPRLLAQSNHNQMQQFEKAITQVRMCSEQLERQFNRVEYLVATQRASD
jgi:hypothetical protein